MAITRRQNTMSARGNGPLGLVMPFQRVTDVMVRMETVSRAGHLLRPGFGGSVSRRAQDELIVHWRLPAKAAPNAHAVLRRKDEGPRHVDMD